MLRETFRAARFAFFRKRLMNVRPEASAKKQSRWLFGVRAVWLIVSTLALRALFNPLRHRVQDVIDHRFYRRKYDAQQVLARFAQTARDEVELEQLTGELLNVVSETMQPASVSLWMRRSKHDK